MENYEFLNWSVEKTKKRKSFIDNEKLKSRFPGMDIIDGKKTALGIQDSSYWYLNVNNEQIRDDEYIKIKKFLDNIIKSNPLVLKENTKLEFINYGDTELVYVVHEENKKRTLLVSQPATKFGTVKKEYNNLIKLHKENPQMIVCPTDYFTYLDKEAYLTPYIYQARCIATQSSGYGIYIPEPFYRFENFTKDDEYLINKSIVACLVKLYNEEEKLGLASCKIGGGDFILEKEYDKEEHNVENTLKRLHLIAARDLINIELKDYLKLLREELSKRTYYSNLSERDTSILINHKNRYPMMIESIEDGISLGLNLRK